MKHMSCLITKKDLSLWLTVSTSKFSSSLMLKRRSSSSSTNLSHIPRSSWHQLHSPGRLSSSEYDISYVHNSKIKLVHILAQVLPEFTEKSGMTFAKIGHIERLKFAGTEMNQHSAKHRPLGGVTCKHDRPLGQAHILFEQHKIYISKYLIGLILTWAFNKQK